MKRAAAVFFNELLTERCFCNLKSIEIRAVELFEGADQRLHAEFGVGLAFTEVCKADFYLVAKFCCLLCYLGHACFVPLR